MNKIKKTNLKIMKNTEYYLLLMKFNDGFYGEYGDIYDIHELGYAEICEEYTLKFDAPWYVETYGIIANDNIKLIGLTNEGLICEIEENIFGLIPESFYIEDNKFYESLLDSYAVEIGFKNGIVEYDGELDIEKLKLILEKKSIELFSPFGGYGYFEKLSTIQDSVSSLRNEIDTTL